MNEIEWYVELLRRSEKELDAWRDANPDKAVHGDTIELITDLRRTINRHERTKRRNERGAGNYKLEKQNQ